MLGPLGTEVAYQWVSSCSDATAVNGCIAVRSNLPANAGYTWVLQSGIAPTASPANPVQMNIVGNNIELTNGLTGVRIITQAANGSPWNLAPIQGIWLPGAARGRDRARRPISSTRKRRRDRARAASAAFCKPRCIRPQAIR